MLFLELAGLSIVAIYVVSQMPGQPERGHFLIRIVLVAAASWIAEESCVFLYEFYGYNSVWNLFLADIPLLVIFIWPLIVHSAWDLASQLLRPGHRLVPLAAATIVLTDASLIEPVGVHTRLWSWNQAGIFDVPPIGILGWAYFAMLCIFLFEKERRQNGKKRINLLIPVLPVIGTHLLLLITWWGALRWAKIHVDPRLAAGGAWALSLYLVYFILKHRIGTRVKRKTLLLRLVGAIFFFTWFALNVSNATLLIVYGVAFVPPYLTLMARQYLASSPKRIRGYP
ncbi:MAG: hypothetical protein PVI06_08470 [Desulfobacterales bacterium]|jgi:hypothetical protein